MNHCTRECRAGQCVGGEGPPDPARPAFDCAYAEFYTEELPGLQRTQASADWAQRLREMGKRRDEVMGDDPHRPGWCKAKVSGAPPGRFCPCLPGREGYLCGTYVMQVCPNQCAGNGRCDRGSCICDPGFSR